MAISQYEQLKYYMDHGATYLEALTLIQTTQKDQKLSDNQPPTQEE